MSDALLSFIAPVRHPRNARDYARVERYLRATLTSVGGQTNRDFQIIVVCNRLPSFRDDFPGVTFLEVDFPPPTEQRTPTMGIDAVRLDKGTKHTVGLLHVLQNTPSEYVMFFDADDLLSNRLVEFLASRNGAPGFYMENGYTLKMGGNLLKPTSNFYQVNGNANIVKLADLPVPAHELTPSSHQEDIVAALDRDFLLFELGSHKFTRDRMAARGVVMEPVPFPGAIYLVGNLENHSGNYGARGSVPVSREHIEEFTIPREYLTLGPKTKMLRLGTRMGEAVRKIAGIRR